MNIFQKLYYNFLGLFFDNSPVINSFEQEDTYWYKTKNIVIDEVISINQLEVHSTNIQNYILHEENLNICNKVLLDLPNVIFKNPNDIFNKSIKWIYKKVQLICVSRNYPLTINKENLAVNEDKVRFWASNNRISDNDLKIKRKLRITEELVGMEPYTNKYDISKILKLPIIKSPIPRSEISKKEMDYLREKLATQAQTKKINVNVLNVYDRFSLGMFASIKQSENSSEIKGFLGKDNKKISTSDIYYLVIGCRKDNNNVIKVLVKPKDLEQIS